MIDDIDTTVLTFCTVKKTKLQKKSKIILKLIYMYYGVSMRSEITTPWLRVKLLKRISMLIVILLEKRVIQLFKIPYGLLSGHIFAILRGSPVLIQA
jgi:hypothetical protein